MEVKVFNNAEELSLKLSEAFTSYLIENKDKLIVLPTGRTPLLLYKKLAVEMAGKDYRNHNYYINLDEFGGISPNDEASCQYYLQKNFYQPLSILDQRIITLTGFVEDIPAVEEKIRGIPRGFCLLGLGVNGHVGMNEPGVVPAAGIIKTKLTPETRMLADFFFKGREVPEYGITFGLREIAKFEKIIMVATGSRKKEAVRKLLKGNGVTPAAYLKDLYQFELWIDSEAL